MLWAVAVGISLVVYGKDRASVVGLYCSFFSALRTAGWVEDNSALLQFFRLEDSAWSCEGQHAAGQQHLI